MLSGPANVNYSLVGEPIYSLSPEECELVTWRGDHCGRNYKEMKTNNVHRGRKYGSQLVDG